MLNNWINTLLRSQMIAALLLIACLGGTAAALFGLARELHTADQALSLPREGSAVGR